MLADLRALEKRVTNSSSGPIGDAESIQTSPGELCHELNAGRSAPVPGVAPEDDKAWRMLQLLTSKPALYVSNVDEASGDRQRHPGWWPSAPSRRR